MNKKNVCIVGLGYVGFPLALQASYKGFNVTGYDVNNNLIDDLKKGKIHLKDEHINQIISKTNVSYTYNLPKDQDIYIICVPTPINKKKLPDISIVEKATKTVSKVIKDNSLIIIESTINPGVCDDIVKPILDESNKKYLLAHCPERINPGDNKWNVSNIPRVVGGLNKQSVDEAYNFYSKIIDAEIVKVSSIKAAEATKILENTFRDVNIAFVNEMAQSFYKLGIDIKEVIKGASSKPFGFMPHYPGLGVGGHCIAVDPYYMIQRGQDVGFEHNFLIKARKINSAMPRYCANAIQNTLNYMGLPIKNTKIAILGISYKPNVSDDRESPTYDLINLLKAREAKLTIYDPHFPEKSSTNSLKEAIKDVKCVVIATAHKEFLDESLYQDIPFIFDGRNCLNKNKLNKNTIYKGVGVGKKHEHIPHYDEVDL